MLHSKVEELAVRPAWRSVKTVPRQGSPDLGVSEEAAPGRTDHPNHVIAGYCPPKARLYAFGKGRLIVTREPCSGTTQMAIRTSTGEQRVADVNLYGVSGTWRAVPMSASTALMISRGQLLNLLLVDLAAARAYYLRMPGDLEHSSGVEVTVANGEIFLSGGSRLVSVGSGGCDNPPPGQGCDPYVIRQAVANTQVWAIRPF